MTCSSLPLLIFATFWAAALALEQVSCPAALNRVGTVPFHVSLLSGSVDFSLCKPLEAICISSRVCLTPNCCKVCQTWCTDPASGCGSCLGKDLAKVVISARTISLLYTGGDVVYADPPLNGPRQVWVNVSYDVRGGQMGNFTFTDPGASRPPPSRKDGDPWIFGLRASSSQIFSPQECSKKTDCEKCAATGCAWCHDSKRCMKTEELGKKCLGNWVTNPDLCPAGRCKSYQNCSTCLSGGTPGCSWCFGGGNTNFCLSNKLAGADTCPNGSFNQSKYCP